MNAREMNVRPCQRSAFVPVIALALSLLVGDSRALADSRPAPTFRDTMEVTEVVLDVLVMDRDGRVVLGLDADDFVVEEKGRGEVPVSDVAFYSNRVLLDGDAASDLGSPGSATGDTSDRFFVLFFHDVRRLDEPDRRLLRQQFDAARESKEWIRKGLLPGDWLAVASWDVKLKVHRDFSRDREALQEAVDDALMGRDPGNLWPSRSDRGADERPSLLRRLPSGNELRDETATMYDALRLLGESLGAVPGRKNVLLFTIGFGELSGRFLSRPHLRYYPQMEQTLNDHNVAVYPIDLTPPRFEHGQTHFLQQLADDTGGVYWDQFVAFVTPLERISAENNGYYLLSYRAEHPAGESGFQEVEVRTADPTLRIRSRAGYRFGERE